MNNFLISKLIKKPKHIIRFSDSIEKASMVILRRVLPNCPVIDDNGMFAGQLTDSALLKILFMKNKNVNLLCIRHVKKYLICPPTISIYATNKEIVAKIFESQSHRIFVLDRNKLLVGVVEAKNLIRELMNNK
jgi:CBS-domain-containing membrane protein